MKRYVALAALLSCLVGVAPPAVAEKFGNKSLGNLTGPYAHLVEAAQYNLNLEKQAGRCTNMTIQQLIAMTLPPTWAEVAGKNVARIPSPATLGRGDFLKARSDDTNRTLYYRERLNDHGRVFWHAALGTWQVDDSGQKLNLAGGGFHAYYTVTELVLKRYCQSPFTDPSKEDERVRLVYSGTWYGCDLPDDGIASNGKELRGNGRWCLAQYKSMWNMATPDQFQRGHEPDGPQNPLVDYWGGAVIPRRCEWGAGATTKPLPTTGCAYVDPSQVDEAAATDWSTNTQANPHGGGTNGNGPNPLSLPFYIFYTGSGDERTEWRVWLNADLPTHDVNIRASRKFGVNSRGGGLKWEEGSWDMFCDTTAEPDRCA